MNDFCSPAQSSPAQTPPALTLLYFLLVLSLSLSLTFTRNISSARLSLSLPIITRADTVVYGLPTYIYGPHLAA